MKGTESNSVQKVAVILPTYNGERFLAEQMDSILNQTFRDFLIFIFDDASSDRTIEIIEQYRKKDTRINLKVNKRRKGVIQNISDALRQISADVYFLADQDDIWLAEKIRRQMIELQSPDVLLSFTNLELIDEKGNSLGTDFWTSQNINPDLSINPDILSLNSMVTGCTMAFKKELLSIALPISSSATMHDHWLSFFASVQNGIKPLHQKLVKYRQHSTNIIGALESKNAVRSKRYQSCSSYSDFKRRKDLSIKVIVSSLQAFFERLESNEKVAQAINDQIVFFESIIERQFFRAFQQVFKQKRLYIKLHCIKVLVISCFFPFVFPIIKTLSSGKKE